METDESKPSQLLLFRGGYEGGSIELYTSNMITLAPVWRESNEMTFDETDDEVWVSNRTEYADFATYWQQFTGRKSWFYCVPLPIHPAIHTHVHQQLDQVRSQPHNPSQLLVSRYVARWQRALDASNVPAN